MIDDMISHLESTPAALPLLQFAAAQLWEARDPRRKLLTKQSYGALGGIAGALVSHADRVIGKLPPICRRWRDRCSCSWSPPSARAPCASSRS